MTDIVERLREADHPLHQWAADEIERLREIVKDDPDKWSFDALMFMAKRILAEVYPADIFDGSSGDSGPAFVVALRNVVEQIEAKA